VIMKRGYRGRRPPTITGKVSLNVNIFQDLKLIYTFCKLS
jgi:hypothetical protein